MENASQGQEEKKEKTPMNTAADKKAKKNDPKKLGTTSIVLALISFIIFGIPFAAAALAIGVFGLMEAKKKKMTGSPMTMNVAGIILAIVSLVLNIVLT
jgi:hypothetical protein